MRAPLQCIDIGQLKSEKDLHLRLLDMVSPLRVARLGPETYAVAQPQLSDEPSVSRRSPPADGCEGIRLGSVRRRVVRPAPLDSVLGRLGAGLDVVLRFVAVVLEVSVGEGAGLGGFGVVGGRRLRRRW